MVDEKMLTGDVAGPYFWQGLDTVLTSDTVIYKTVAAADGALIGFMTMIYNIIYLRQGHGGRGFDQDKLQTLLGNANIGIESIFIVSIFTFLFFSFYFRI